MVASTVLANPDPQVWCLLGLPEPAREGDGAKAAPEMEQAGPLEPVHTTRKKGAARGVVKP